MEGFDDAMSRLAVHSLEGSASTARGNQSETPSSEPEVALSERIRGVSSMEGSETEAAIFKLPAAAQAARSDLCLPAGGEEPTEKTAKTSSVTDPSATAAVNQEAGSGQGGETQAAAHARGPAVDLSGAAEGRSEGTAGKKADENGPGSATNLKYLAAVERMTALQYKGDVFLLQGNLHAAALEYSRGLEVKCGEEVTEEERSMCNCYWTMVLEFLHSRIYVCSCLSERAAAGGEHSLSRQFLHRVLWDSRDLQRSPTADKQIGFAVAARALVKLGNPVQVAVAMLVSGLIQCESAGIVQDVLAAYMRQGGGHGNRVGLFSQVLENQDRWQDGAEDNTAWLEEMEGDKRLMDLLGRKSRLEDSSLGLESTEFLQQVYKPVPISGSVLMDEKHPSLIELDSDPAGENQVSAFTEGILKMYHEGLYGENSCSKACCQQRVTPSAVQSGGGGTSTGSNARKLEVAKRCLHIGNAQAEAGRLVLSVRWYTRGVTVLLPKNWEHFREERHTAGVLAAALALLFNRCQIHLHIGASPHLTDDNRLLFNSHGARDALWCAYYGRGWPWGTIALSQALVKAVPYSRLDWLVLKEEIKKRGEEGSPRELVEARDILRDVLTEEEKDDIPWSRAPEIFKFLASGLSNGLGEIDDCNVSIAAMKCMTALASNGVNA